MKLIHNIAENHYTQTTTCATIEGTAKSNEAKVTLFDTLATLTKSPDNIFVELDDIIPYQLVFQNTTSLTLTQLEVIDALPEGIQFVPNSLRINGTPSSEDIQSGITFSNPIIPGGQVTLTFEGRVAQIPPTQYKNTATARYTYQLDPSLPPTTFTIDSNTVTATAVQGILAVVKEADTAEAQQDDTIIYTVTITNVGNVPATDMVFFDTLIPQVEYVPNTFAINNEVLPGEIDFVKGIPLGNVDVAETMLVNFTVRLIDDSILTVPNRGSIDYDFVKDPDVAPVRASRESNLVVVPVQRNDISIVKSSDKETIVVDEPITYTLEVINNGTILAENIIVKDILPIGMRFTPGSVRVNGSPVSGDIAEGISIPSLQPNASSTITFVATAIAIPPFIFTNSASVDYTYQIDNVTFNQTEFSNPVTVRAPFISIAKSASVTTLKKGDTTTFTLVIDNKGDAAIGNLSVSDILQPPLKLVPNTLTIDGTPTTGDLANLPLPELASGGTTVVSFDVDVPACDGDAQVINTATLRYTPSGNLSYSITSNPITIQVDCEPCNIFLCAAKCVNTPKACLGDTLTYSIYINNPSAQAVENIVVKDSLDPHLNYVPCSLIVNDTPTTGTPSMIKIDSIPAMGYARIIFQAKITQGCKGDTIDNLATIEYTGCDDEVLTVKTNPTSVTIENCCSPQPQPPCECHQECVLTPIVLPTCMKPISKVIHVDGFIRSVKPINYGHHMTKLLVTYVMTLEYCCSQGYRYTHQELEEVCFEVPHYSPYTQVEIIRIEEPCIINPRRIEVIVQMGLCDTN